jgi:hypothetical protein
MDDQISRSFATSRLLGAVAMLAVVAGMLAACGTQPSAGGSGGTSGTSARSGPNVNLSGYPPAFKDGFRDGCDSLRGNYRRDGARFGKDNDYTLGWQDGYSICGRQQYR